MITQIVTHVHFVYLSILVLDLDKDIFEKVVKMLLNRGLGNDRQSGDLCRSAVLCYGNIRWIVIQVGEEDRLTEGWLVVDA